MNILMKRPAIIIVGLLLAAKCMAATHYVVPPGTAGVTPADPFTNWVTAGTSIVEVVNAAVTNTGGRLVWVTNGTYYPTASIYIANASLFRLQSVNGRDKTILNGSQTTNRCTYFDYQSLNCVFDGFTVTNYYFSPDAGRGTVYGPVITVINCLFTGNTNLTGNGGAIMEGKGGATITNCIFRNNYSVYGGALYIAGGYPLPTTQITDCRFEGNKVIGNYGGAFYFGSSNIIVSNCVFISNSASSIGGAIYISSTATNSLVVNCTFTGNSGTYGGGIANYGKVTVRNCSLVENVAVNGGGGIYGNNITIRNSLVARNRTTGNTGGGIYMGQTSLVENCTIVSNYAGLAGGGVYLTGAGSGTNNIVYFNTAPSAANFTNAAGNIGLDYSCVIPAVAGTGNITNNPVLKDLAGGDYRLRMTSPCVNTGTNQLWMMNAVDLQGNARILKIIVDMGAYETRLWQGTIFSVP